MAAVPAVPSAVKFVNTYTFYTRIWVTIHHALKGDNVPWDIAQCLATATSFYTASQHLLGHLSSHVSFISTECQDLAADNSFAVYTPESPYPGQIAGDPGLPINCCVVGSWGLGVKYRGGKPRTYLSGIIGTATTDGRTLGTTIADEMQGDFSAFLTAVNAIADPNSGEISLACIAYSRNHQPLADPQVNPITSVEVHERLDSQRRRLGKESAYGIVYP